MDIFFVTSNSNKLSEIRTFFKNSIFRVSGYKLNLPEIQSEDQYELLKHKLKTSWKKIRKPLIVDDTAIYFERLSNFPGTITKQLVSGLGIEGVQKIIQEGEPVYFRTLIGYADKDLYRVFEGILRGKLTKKSPKKVNPKAQFSSIFIPLNQKKTLEEINHEIFPYHRILALEKLKKHLMKRSK